MTERVQQICQVCGSNFGFSISDDGFFYCGHCNSQADDIVDTGVDEEQILTHYSLNHSRVRHVNALVNEPITEIPFSPSKFLDGSNTVEGDGFGQAGPSDFGSCQNNVSYDDYNFAIRSRYLTGLQIMIQLQCQTLVEKFNVSPLILGLVGPLWLRFLFSTRITADGWADQVVHDSEAQTQGEPEEFQPSARSCGEPVNILGKRVVMIWYKSLRSKIPISYSLAISFLACHVAREAILPSDMLKWTIEGNLPYFSAFCEIEKMIGSRSKACPISANHMFRPTEVVSSQKLESMAAGIAQKIGLELPPVNFYAIASRYCKHLSLPSKEILPLAYRIYEWSMPSELYLSVNEDSIPTRVYAMSILIVALRILYDINGHGIWESSLSNPSSSSQGEENEDMKSQFHCDTSGNADDQSSNNLKCPRTKSSVQDSGLDYKELLRILEAKYDKLEDVYAYSQDLSTYLQYCKDVVFAGLQPSFEDREEEKLIEEFWEIYQSSKGGRKQNIQDDCSHSCENASQGSQPSKESHKDRRIKQMKLNMEENKFCYVPPRNISKRNGYLHYARRKKEIYLYAVHADYYILLRSCAKAARVESRIMHLATLYFERRLKSLENRIKCSLF